MTAGEVSAWLAERSPAPPAAVAARLAHVLRGYPAGSLGAAGSMAVALGEVGLATLASLAGRADAGDETALDLLAADAFVTYAFEAAAESGVAVRPLARALLTGVDG